MAIRYKTRSQILSSMTDYILTHTDTINDFTTGSAIESIDESISQELEEYYYLTIENIKQGVQDSIFEAFGFERIEASPAFGNLTISISPALEAPLTIFKGTTFTSSNSNYQQSYQTISEYSYPKGTTVATVPVYCTESGTYGNVPAGTIDTCNQLLSNYHISNEGDFQTGQEEETMSHLKTRFNEFIQSIQRGTPQAIAYAASTVTGISSVRTYDPVPGFLYCYCADTNGDLSEDLKEQVAKAVEPYRGGGINVTILPIHKTTIDAYVGITVSDDSLAINGLLDVLKQRFSNALNNYTVGQSLTIKDLIKVVMDLDVYGVTDCELDLSANPDIVLRGGTDITDTNDIYIGAYHVTPDYYQPKDRFTKDDTSLLASLVPSGKVTKVENVDSVSAIDASTVQNSDGSYDELDIDSRYVSANNEILKAGTINVYFSEN